MKGRLEGMKKYKINGGYDDERTVEAASYNFQDGYFHFSDADKSRVFSIKAERVHTIERIEA